MSQEKTESIQLANMSLALREAYARGDNVMEFARTAFGHSANTPFVTLMAYDLQAGSYIAAARKDPAYRMRWCGQIAGLLAPFIGAGDSLLEAGCGEATTLSGVLQALPTRPLEAFGFDISWSRCAYGLDWLRESAVAGRLFVGNLFEIPLQDDSIDVVYTAHSLEPNGGRELEAIRELLRVARRAVVLIEPIYELASDDARKRMDAHGYVRNLRGVAEELGAEVMEHRLLEIYANPLNPSGVLILRKDNPAKLEGGRWRCPVTYSPLREAKDAFLTDETGLVYPILGGVPLLRSVHAVVASAYGDLAGC